MEIKFLSREWDNQEYNDFKIRNPSFFKIQNTSLVIMLHWNFPEDFKYQNIKYVVQLYIITADFELDKLILMFIGPFPVLDRQTCDLSWMIHWR